MQRVARVVLRGEVGDLLGKLKATSSAVKATASALTESSKEAKQYRQDLIAVGDSAGKLGLVAAGGVALAVRSFANFDQAMSNVAATGDDARQSINALREAAIQAGARTQYSATEAAGAIENLAKAGVSAKDILDGGLDGALDLAAAGGLDVAQAAEYAAIAMTQFDLAGRDLPHVADLLAAGAGKANGEVSDLGAALAQAGLVADQTGLSVEETTAGLAAFASAGLLGSDAGTSFKSMLQRLTPQSDKAAALMDDLGLRAYDAQGNFIGLEAYAGRLQQGLQGLSAEQRNAALTTLFGSDAVRAASALYEEGAEGVAKWTAAVDDEGYAAETAATRMQNLKGDFEQLGGALETALIGTGEGANGPLRELVQLLTSVVDGYNKLPAPIKTTVLATGALTAGIGSTLFVAARAIDTYSNLKESLSNLGGSFEQANKKAIALRGGAIAAGIGLASISSKAHDVDDGLGTLTDTVSAAALGFGVAGPWGAAIGGTVGLLSSLMGSSDDAAVSIEGLTATLDQQTGALTENSAQWVTKQFQDSGAAEVFDKLGVSLATATDAALGNKDAMAELAEIRDELKDPGDVAAFLDDHGFKFDEVSDVADALDQIDNLRSSVRKGSDAIRENATATDESVEAQAAAAEAFEETGGAAEEAAEAIDAFNDQLDALFDPLLGQEDASNAWRDAIASLTEELRKNGTSLSDNSAQGRANQDAIRDRVKALKDSVAADAEAGVGQDKLAAKLNLGAKKIVEAGKAAGISEKSMRGYLKQLGLTPDQIKTLITAVDEASPKIDGVNKKADQLEQKRQLKIAVDTAAALNQLRGVKEYIAGMNGKTLRIAVEGGAPGGITRASGGPVIGPGSKTSDSIPAMLSNGEHVWTADEVAGAGGQGSVYRLRAMAAAGLLPKYATGGAVGFDEAVTGLELTQMRIRVRDLRRSLRETEKYKPKGSKTQLTRNVLRGLDRLAARQELAEALRDLRSAEKGTTAARRRGMTAEGYNKYRQGRIDKDAQRDQDAAEKKKRDLEELRSAKASIGDDIRSGAGIGQPKSAASVLRNLRQSISSSAELIQVLIALKKKGAAPWLLNQLYAAGPSKATIRVAREFLTDSAKLREANGLVGQLDSVAGVGGRVMADPRWDSKKAWNANVAGTQSALNGARNTTLSVQLDGGYMAREVARLVSVELASQNAGAVLPL